MDSRIYIFRHGITTGNAKNHLYGSSDLHLTNEGIDALKEAAAAGKYPDGENADIYTTGMYRTEQTFNCLYPDREHRIIEPLHEMDFGEYENVPIEDAVKTPFFRNWMTENDYDITAPGGENFNEFRERVWTGFDELLGYHRLKELSVRHNGRPAVSILLSHLGTILAVMSRLFPDDVNSLAEWVVSPGNGYCIHFDDGKAVSWEKYKV